jgi:hypothetical protein
MHSGFNSKVIFWSSRSLNEKRKQQNVPKQDEVGIYQSAPKSLPKSLEELYSLCPIVHSPMFETGAFSMVTK